jgi:cytochrome c biogenesis protein CcdA
MDSVSLGLAFLAGLISIFSPCVLPLLPVVLSTAVAQHRFGPVALALGLALSFLILGLFVALVGFALGLDFEVFRLVAAILLVLAGAVLAVPILQARFALAAAPFAEWAGQRFGTQTPTGLPGQFAIELLLGAVWTPCTGPTLGAASVLAAQGRDLPHVVLTMLLFAAGTLLPLLVLGLLSRGALLRWRAQMLSTGQSGKMALGLLLIAAGALIITGFDKSMETALLQLTPGWLLELTTEF